MRTLLSGPTPPATKSLLGALADAWLLRGQSIGARVLMVFSAELNTEVVLNALPVSDRPPVK